MITIRDKAWEVLHKVDAADLRGAKFDASTTVPAGYHLIENAEFLHIIPVGSWMPAELIG